MIPIVHLIQNLEKELDLERQGLRRTRRYIGDVSQAADSRWYQRQVSQVADGRSNPGEDCCQDAENKPKRPERRSILARLFHRSSPRRQPVSHEKIGKSSNNPASGLPGD